MTRDIFSMKQHFCITFAGPMGSSKTPIAYYLSYNLGLPIYNNDTIRTEVREDLLEYQDEEFQTRRKERLEKLVESKRSFILDASVDRRWSDTRERLEDQGYKWFVISMDISKELLLKMYEAKGYLVLNVLPANLAQHDAFVKEHAKDIRLHINDDNFLDRLNLSLASVKKWMEKEGLN